MYCAYAILIELLIVIVILGVLAAAIIPNLSKFVSSGTIGAANAELASIRTAVAAYSADSPTGAYPPSPQNPTTSDLNIYIMGVIKGAYTISTAGLVTGTTYPSVVFL